ncbi:MAG: hypothetical protein IT385_08335 [Deltaproteobacteria bacterium]|nr:hypothetical protein [Deltaproteobacteria bacterium]
MTVKLPTQRLELALAAALAVAASACAEERPAIDRTQPDRLDKKYFLGEDFRATTDDPEFYMVGTLVDVGYGASQDGLFTNTYAQPVSRVKFVVTEGYLIARITYERVDGSDGKGAGVATNDGVIAAMYKIQSHFDVVQAYNSTTGEKLNIIEENTSDRPWYERQYMRVDWSSNHATNTYDFDTLAQIGVWGAVKYEPVNYYVNDPSDEDAPRIELDDGYFDVTVKAFASPQTIDLSMFDWGIDFFPACYLEADFLSGSYPGGSCNPVELTIRQAFRRVTPTDYEPAHWDGMRFQAYGAFTTDRFGYARHYGMSDSKWHRFISRYNIWERSHYHDDQAALVGEIPCFTPITTPYGADPHRDVDQDGTEDECQTVTSLVGMKGSRCDEFSQKCTLPYRARTPKPIVWYYSDKNDGRYFDSSLWATHEWDAAMRSAVQTARYAECKRTKEADCSQWPIYTGQQDDNEDAIKLVTEVEDCRAGRAYPERGGDCDGLADELGAARGYHPGVIALAKMDAMVVLCHSPVTHDDHQACGDRRMPEGMDAAACEAATDPDVREACDRALVVRLGDIRYHQVTVTSTPQTESPWGIMADGSDPLTGEKVAASINVWSSITDRWSQGIVDTARYIGGELELGDITEGEYVRDWSEASEAASGSGAIPKMRRDEMRKKLADFVGRDASMFDDMEPPRDARPFEAAREIKQQLKRVAAKIDAPSGNAATYAARRQQAAGTQVEAALLTPMMQQLAGVAGMPISPSVMKHASPLRGMNPSVQRDYHNRKEVALAKRGACMVHEAPAPLAIADVAKILQRKFGDFDPSQSKPEQQARADKMFGYIADRAHYAVVAHEMGHSFALRHNFVSSADAHSYRPQYWQLRTKNGTVTALCDDLSSDGEDCVGPRYFDPVTQNEKDNLIWMFMQDSSMEYPGEATQDMQGIAAYDFAATRMFYGDVVPVYADSTYNAGQRRSVGVHARLDSFGGILGLIHQDGPDEIHYSALQNAYQIIKDCKTIDPQSYRPASWNEAAHGVWDPVFDGRLVAVDGAYSVCETQPVDYVNWTTMKMPTAGQAGGAYYGGPSIDRDNRTRVPYGFGTDDWADLGNLSVYRSDNGADPYELFNFLITQQEVSHLWDNYRRGRQDFSVRGAAYRSLWRYNEKLRDAGKGLGLIKNIYEYVAREEGWNFDEFWPSVAPFWFPENVLTAGMAFDHFTRLLARPQTGDHYFPPGEDVLRSEADTWGTPTARRVTIPNGATGYYGNVQFGGRMLENALATGLGEYDSDYTMNAGSYYDKTWSAMLMTESVDNFISSTRGDFFDARYRSVSVADLFPDGYRRWLANNLTGDDHIKAPRLSAGPDGRPEIDSATGFPTKPIGWTSWWPPAGPEVCFPNEESQVCSRYGDATSDPFDPQAVANVAVIDPQVGWEQQKFLIAWTLVYLPENQQQWWLDRLRMWELGADADPGFDNRIELHVPGGKVYVAHTFGSETIFGKRVQKGIAARVLEYANELMAEAYEVDEVTGPDGTTWYEAKLNALTGQPIVRWDPTVQAVTPDGEFSETGNPGCNATDNSKCTCTANRACMKLREYVQVPFFLRQSLAAFGMWDPEWKGVW